MRFREELRFELGEVDKRYDGVYQQAVRADRRLLGRLAEPDYSSNCVGGVTNSVATAAAISMAAEQ